MTAYSKICSNLFIYECEVRLQSDSLAHCIANVLINSNYQNYFSVDSFNCNRDFYSFYVLRTFSIKFFYEFSIYIISYFSVTDVLRHIQNTSLFINNHSMLNQIYPECVIPNTESNNFDYLYSSLQPLVYRCLRITVVNL